METLADISLGERLARFAEKVGERVVGVFTVNLSGEVTTGNAAIMGMVNTRWIVIGDTILGQYSEEEIEVIVAHELGHHIPSDIVKLIALQAVAILSGFYLTHLIVKFSVQHYGFNGISDVEAFPLLALALGGLSIIMVPLTCAYTRYIESTVDEYALTLTNNPGGFTTLMSKLANQNLSEAKPARWVELLFYDHPPYFRRVERA